MRYKTIIGIYDIDTELLAHLVDTIEEACEWIQCGSSTLYDSLHREGVMKARGYTVERVTITEEGTI